MSSRETAQRVVFSQESGGHFRLVFGASEANQIETSRAPKLVTEAEVSEEELHAMLVTDALEGAAESVIGG